MLSYSRILTFDWCFVKSHGIGERQWSTFVSSFLQWNQKPCITLYSQTTFARGIVGCYYDNIPCHYCLCFNTVSQDQLGRNDCCVVDCFPGWGASTTHWGASTQLGARRLWGASTGYRDYICFPGRRSQSFKSSSGWLVKLGLLRINWYVCFSQEHTDEI